MKQFTFPYYISFGKNDSVDCEITIELTDEDAARLVTSANEGGRFRLSEDERIEDIYDAVFTAIMDREKQALMDDPEPVADALSWEEDFDPDADITEEQIDDYLDDLEMDINYPEELQGLPRTVFVTEQSSCERVIVEHDAAENYVRKAENQTKVVFTDGGQTLYYVPKSYSDRFVIPDSVRKISYTAFKNRTRITEIVIENGLEVIDEWAFEGCTSLARVTIPPSVKEIDFNAFTECKELTEVIFSEGLEELDDTAFRSCYQLKELHFPASLKSVDTYIAAYWNGLERLYFAGRKTEIEGDAENFENITIFAPPRSRASAYAKEHKIKRVILKSES